MIRIRELTDVEDPALKVAYSLLTRSFHRDERVLLREWKSSLAEKESGLVTDGVWHLLVAEQDGEVIGLNSGAFIGSINLGMIGYLAIDDSARSLGLGTRLRNRLRRLFEKDALRLNGKPLSGILGEVNERNPWLRTLARRPNVLALDFQYFQPSLAEGDAPSPFVLYLEQLDGVRTSIPARELRQILYAIWRTGYRIARPLEHAVFRTMLRSFKDRRTVGRRTLTVLEPS